MEKGAADKAGLKGFDEGHGVGKNDAYARINAILADPRVKGHELWAVKAAIKSPSLPNDEICALCEDLPTALHGGMLLAEKIDATGVNAIRSGAAPNQTSADSWGNVISKMNSRSPAGRAAQ